METKRWINQSQPQTLQIAVILLYINAVFGLIGLLAGAGLAAITVAGAAGGYGIANERKWGYGVALVVAFLPLVLRVAYGDLTGNIIGLMFDIALVALLVHPQSRDYQRIWFR